ncbi:MAG: leucine-rich repeat domain-containing protein [Paludibacteraceae bacterium]|nr:leucine-rich repeat domain-containing protein [Paludibacteraceae bacterium]
MKNFLLSLCVALLSCVAFAQTNVVVVLKNGTNVKYLAEDIDSIRIEKITAVPEEETGLNFSYDWKTMTATVIGTEKHDYSIVECKIPAQVIECVGEDVYYVTAIGSDVFSACTSLTSIEIPNTVTSIGSAAFWSCTSLTSIEIPESVTEIGSAAFYKCTNLTSIEIPNSVTEIYSSTFYGCTSLTSIVIPNSVTKIGWRAFDGCTSLTSIEIPNSVTSIGSEAFSECTSLTSIVIPNSVTEIGMWAFLGCENLKTARVPKGLDISNAAFPDDCEIEWYDPLTGEKIKSADETGLEFEYIISTMTASVTGLTDKEAKEVKIPSQVLYDGNMYDVTKIGAYAFLDCNFTSINIPESVTEIGHGIFMFSGIRSIIVDKNNKVYDSRENCNAIIETASNTLISGCASTIIPNSVTSIGKGAFANYRVGSFTSIEIPNSVTSIGEDAFNGCWSLETVVIGNSVTTIGARAFFDCEFLTSINIPNSVKEIGIEAFSDCFLTSIEIPKSVTVIGSSAFRNCWQLKTARVPESLRGKVGNVFPSTCEIEYY